MTGAPDPSILLPVLALVAAAGGLGAVARYGVNALLARAAPRFPWGVLVVNVLGSALGGAGLGGLVVWITARGGGHWDAVAVALILLTGFCGGLTTFSTFAVDTVQLAERDEKLLKANLNVVANVVLGLGAAVVGYAITIAIPVVVPIP